MKLIKIIKCGLIFALGAGVGAAVTHFYEKKKYQEELDIVINDYEETIKHINNDFTSLALSKNSKNEEKLKEKVPKNEKNEVENPEESDFKRPDLKNYPKYEEGEYTMYDSIRKKYVLEDSDDNYETKDIKKSKKKQDYGSPEYNNYVLTSSRTENDQFWPISEEEFANSKSEVSILFYYINSEEITDDTEDVIGDKSLKEMIGIDSMDFLMDQAESLLDYQVNQIYIYNNFDDVIYMIIIKPGAPKAYDND